MALEYNRRDFTGWSFKDRPEYDFNVQYIRASCFSQEKPDTESLPDNMPPVEFIGCNMDNVKIPPQCKLTDCSQRRFIAIDGVDTLLNADDSPIGPIDGSPDDAELTIDDFSPDVVKAVQDIVLSVLSGKKTVETAINDAAALADTLDVVILADSAVVGVKAGK